MNIWKLIYITSLTAILLVPRLSYKADAPATYNVVTTQEMYLPAYPCHVDDPRYAKSDFETRTVTILQPYQDRQPLQNRPVIFYVHGGGWTDDYADMYTPALTPTLVANI